MIFSLQLDWKSLINQDSASSNPSDELVSNIRHILSLINSKSSEISQFKSDDYIELAKAARRTLDPALLKVLHENNCTDSSFLLKLVELFIANVDDLALSLISEEQIYDASQIIIINRLKTKLECRGMLLKFGFINERTLLDKITTNHPTIISLKSISHKQLNNYCREITHDDHKEILEKLWVKDNDIREKIQKYNLPLNFVDYFQKHNITTVNDLSKQHLELIMSEFSTQANNVDDKCRINCLKANLKRLYQEESDEKKKEILQEETSRTKQSTQTDEAIQMVTKLIKDLKDTSSSNTNVKSDMKTISEKLQIPEWKVTEKELNEPVETLNEILNQLNSVKNLDLKPQEYSDEELITRISGGSALYGISFIDPERLGEKAIRPLLRQPDYCQLDPPALPFDTIYHKFTILAASRQFDKIVQTCGYTVAANISASKWGFHLGGGLSKVKGNSVEQYNEESQLTTELFLTYYSFIPVKSFRIPIEEMQLSNESETFAHSINNLTLAKRFLNDFNSHISTGRHHVGGIYLCTISITTDSLSSTDQLEKIGVNHFNTTIGAGLQKLNVGGSISYESFTDIGKHTQNTQQEKQAQVKSHITCYGPSCTNRDLFHQILYTHNSTWHIIDRSDLKSLIPVWELMKTHKDLCIREAAKFIKRAWLEQALKYSHIPMINCEIQRVMSDGWSPSIIDINFPVQASMSKQDQNNYHDAIVNLESILEKSFSLLTSDDLEGEEISKVIRTVTHIICSSSLTIGFNLLPTILLRDKMKSFLHTISIYCSNDGEKLRIISPALQHLLNSETVSELQQNDIHLDSKIKILLRKVQQFIEEKENSWSDNDQLLINTPVTMLNDLPAKLREMHTTNTENEIILVQKIVQIIKISLIKGESNEQQRLSTSKLLEDMLTSQHGWTSDGFITDSLTHEGIDAVIKDIEDELNHIRNRTLNVTQQQTEAQENNLNNNSVIHRTVSNTNSVIAEEKYSHLDWIIDRPLINIQIDPVAGFIDRLRHRMKLDAISSKSSVAMSIADEDQQLLDQWARYVPTNQADEDQQSSVACENQIFYDLEDSLPQSNNLTDVLIHLTNHSKLTSKIELFRLLLDRRYAVPLITPYFNQGHKQPFIYHVDVFKFIPLSMINHEISYLGDNEKLYRIAIVSRRPIGRTETAHLISTAFNSHSVQETQRSENAELTMVEIAEGYIDDENDKKWPFLVLHVSGNYEKLHSFISDVANLIIIEQDSLGTHESDTVGRTFPTLPVIVWNVSKNSERPTMNTYRHYVLTGTINGIAKNLQIACVQRLKNFNGNRNTLGLVNNTELFYRPMLNKIDILTVIKNQNYATLRNEKLLLQKSFNTESKYRIQLHRSKNDYSEQRALEHKIVVEEDYRRSVVSDIENVDIIKTFTKILQLPNFDQRVVAVNEMINSIDDCSVSTVQEVRRKRDEAFHKYQQAVRQKKENDLYKIKFLEAKAVYAATLVSLEHLWRECIQLYTCDSVRYFYYPDLAAQHLIDGFPLELLDGDAGMICDKWISAVLKKLNTKLQDITKKKTIKIFVLSILGVQSSGKSTLLNMMFGVRFRSSAGQCTRGVNIQLIKVEDRNEYDYILLMDTEGKSG